MHLSEIKRNPFEKQNQILYLYSSQEYSPADDISANNNEKTQANKAQEKRTRQFMKLLAWEKPHFSQVYKLNDHFQAYV